MILSKGMDKSVKELLSKEVVEKLQALTDTILQEKKFMGPLLTTLRMPANAVHQICVGVLGQPPITQLKLKDSAAEYAKLTVCIDLEDVKANLRTMGAQTEIVRFDFVSQLAKCIAKASSILHGRRGDDKERAISQAKVADLLAMQQLEHGMAVFHKGCICGHTL